ncbi:MAG: hypothetical protein JSW46_14245 [Gemmatimonadota bacterium]|nr:MAG: hypothetical protein JSW46_14245 [Gemmatimonadota bacterium]
MSAPRNPCPSGRSTFAFLVGVALLSALWTAACGPKLEDVDGSGLDPVLCAPIENGWVAVDSTDEGLRAVLQLEAEAAQGSLPWDLSELALLFGSDTIPPKRMRCEESAVCRRVRRPVRSPNERAVAEPPDRREEEVMLCDHVVRAEFILPAVPSPADTVLLRLGETTIPLRWR